MELTDKEYKEKLIALFETTECVTLRDKNFINKACTLLKISTLKCFQLIERLAAEGYPNA